MNREKISMKDILIIFCVLLTLLIIITALGGSIRPSEAFTYVVEPKVADEQNWEGFKSTRRVMMEEETHRDTFISGASIAAEEDAAPANGQIIGYDSTENFASL